MREKEPADAWHRRFAVDAFKASWDLLDRDELTDDDEAGLLGLVFASRWHWEQVGTDEQRWMGDHQIANACSHLGLDDLALRFVGRALAIVEANGWGGWRLASCHEGFARAHAAAGDAEGRDRSLARARQALGTETDAEDRAAIEEQLATVPPVNA
jgi:hypothetical protein